MIVYSNFFSKKQKIVSSFARLAQLNVTNNNLQETEWLKKTWKRKELFILRSSVWCRTFCWKIADSDCCRSLSLFSSSLTFGMKYILVSHWQDKNEQNFDYNSSENLPLFGGYCRALLFPSISLKVVMLAYLTGHASLTSRKLGLQVL